MEKKQELLRTRNESVRQIKESNEEAIKLNQQFTVLNEKCDVMKNKATGKNNQTDTMNVESFIQEKKNEKLLNKELSNYVRKIDIIKLRYMKAIKGLRKMGHNLQEEDLSFSERN